MAAEGFLENLTLVCFGGSRKMFSESINPEYSSRSDASPHKHKTTRGMKTVGVIYITHILPS